MKTVRMARGPLTFQWRTSPVAGWALRPMQREGRLVPQVADVLNVPDEVTPGQLMRVMEATCWSPDTTGLLQIDYGWLGLGKMVCAAQGASLRASSPRQTGREVIR